eukprot:1193185-Amorphochlora_amoeboformis.AAC.2
MVESSLESVLSGGDIEGRGTPTPFGEPYPPSRQRLSRQYKFGSRKFISRQYPFAREAADAIGAQFFGEIARTFI